MVVAVVAVRMMEVILHQEINVIPMGNLRMPAVWTVDVVAPVLTTLMPWSTPRRVSRTDLDDVLVDMVVVEMVQVTIMDVIDMITVLDGHVPAPRTMPVAVSFVHSAVRLSHFACRILRSQSWKNYNHPRVEQQPYSSAGGEHGEKDMAGRAGLEPATPLRRGTNEDTAERRR